jgi:hypothetical protein
VSPALLHRPQYVVRHASRRDGPALALCGIDEPGGLGRTVCCQFGDIVGAHEPHRASRYTRQDDRMDLHQNALRCWTHSSPSFLEEVARPALDTLPDGHP